jgi:TolB protein
MRRLLLLLLICSAVQAQELVVEGTARRNPTLSLASWEGDSNVRKYLLHVLRFSNWYDVVESDAELQLQAAYQAGANAIEIRLIEKGKQLVGFRRQASGANAEFVVRHAVDELILRHHKNPGFCTAKLAFVKEYGNAKEIYLAEFDGANPKALTRNQSLSVEPDWGPAGNQLVYTLYNNHRTDVVLVDFQANSQRRVAAFPGLNAAAALSPNGRQAALTLSKDGNPEIYVLDVATRKPTRLTNTKAVESSPCWSPDGKQLCYVSDGGGLRPTIYLSSARGGRAKRLVSGVEAVSPDWSPVSNRICFSMRVGSQYQIAWIDPTKSDSQPTVVSQAAGDWEAPSWAPDGRHIVCSRSYGGRKGLVLLDSWFGRVIPLAKYSGNDTLPAYSGKP